MTIRVPWLNRKFELDVPVEEAPALLAELRGAVERLEGLVRPLPASVRTARRGKKWSIQENAGHLADLEELHLGRLDDYDAHVDFLREADLSNRRTEEAGWNDAPVEDVLAAFRARRERLIARLEALDPARYAQAAIHPRLHVAMRIVDMMKFVVTHDDHHLATIAEAAALAATPDASSPIPCK
ncbi:MAG: DinB family protein [bacterium]